MLKFNLGPGGYYMAEIGTGCTLHGFLLKINLGCILVWCVVDVALAVWRLPTGSARGDTSHPTHSSSEACVWLGPSSIVGLLHRSLRPHPTLLVRLYSCRYSLGKMH